MSTSKNLIFSFSAQILNTIFAFITSIYVTRILGVSGRGEYALFMNSLNFFVLLYGFSINSTITYFINTLKVKQDKLFSSLVFIVFVSTALLAATIGLLYMFNLTEHVVPKSAKVDYYLALMLLLFITNIVSGIVTSLFVTYKYFKINSLIIVAFVVLPLIFYVIYYHFIPPINADFSLLFVLSVTTITAILSIITYVVILGNKISLTFSSSLYHPEMLREVIKFTGMAYLANVAQFLTYRLDIWVVNKYCGSSDLGSYSLAVQFSQMLWIIPSSIGGVIYSQVSHLERTEKLPNKLLSIIPIVFYVTLSCALFGSLLVYYLLPILYGEQFAPTYIPMLILLVGSVLLSYATIITNINAGRGSFKHNYQGSVAGLTLSLPLYPILISHFGIIGGACASTLIYTFQTIFYTTLFCKHEDVHLLKIFKFNIRETYTSVKSEL